MARRSRSGDGPPIEALEDGGSGVRAVERAIAILRSFTAESPAMSVLEIQRRVGLSRPTLYRLLQTLSGAGMIEAEGDPQRFRLSAGVMQLAHAWLSGLDIVDVARPIINQLRDDSGETAALFVLRGNESLCVLEQKSRHVLAISRGVGDSGPLTRGASGKAILAAMSDTQVSAAMTDMSAPARAEIATVIEQVRRDGYALSRGEVFVGALALAAPISDSDGAVIGSIGIFGPSARLHETLVAPLAARVKEAAAALTAQLGHPRSTGTGDSSGQPPAPRRRTLA